MRKQTKRSLTNKLDREISRIVRSPGICAMCGLLDYSKIQCAHIFSRTYRSVRWDRDNLLALCASCHFYSHKNPTIFTEFVMSYLGEEKYKVLRARATAIKKWTIPEMEDLLETYRRII